MKYFKILIIILFFGVSSCKEDIHDIPYVPVDIYIDVNNAIYNDINTIGGYMYLTGGYKGLILYRAAYNQFVAIERACPYHPKTDCQRLVVEPNGLALVDSTCGSRFLILDGSIVNGPAKKPARVYNTMFDGHYLRIYY